MLRRRPARVRRVPAWESVPAFPEPNTPPSARSSVHWVAPAAFALLCLGAWWFARVPTRAVEDISRPKPAADIQQVEVQAAPPAPEVLPDEVQETPRTSTPVPVEAPLPSAPSVGLVDAGAAGGSGNGLPGLDLGLEGGGPGLVVAAGGGGKGAGAGTGVGNGVGSQRMVYQLGQVDQDASADRTDPPPYPRRAKEDLIEAHLELRILVDERGKVEKIEVLGAPPGYGFETAVESASRSWRFQPAQLGGVPVPQWVRMPLDFHLN
jgi:TonB family protein